MTDDKATAREYLRCFSYDQDNLDEDEAHEQLEALTCLLAAARREGYERGRADQKAEQRVVREDLDALNQSLELLRSSSATLDRVREDEVDALQSQLTRLTEAARAVLPYINTRTDQHGQVVYDALDAALAQAHSAS